MELTLPALRRHLAQQADVYGAPLLLSLLGQKGDDGEAELAASLGAGVQQLAEGGGGGGGGAARQPSHDERVDWWAAGCLVYELLSGRPPCFPHDPSPTPNPNPSSLTPTRALALALEPSRTPYAPLPRAGRPSSRRATRSSRGRSSTSRSPSPPPPSAMSAMRHRTLSARYSHATQPIGSLGPPSSATHGCASPNPNPNPNRTRTRTLTLTLSRCASGLSPPACAALPCGSRRGSPASSPRAKTARGAPAARTSSTAGSRRAASPRRARSSRRAGASQTAGARPLRPRRSWLRWCRGRGKVGLELGFAGPLPPHPHPHPYPCPCPYPYSCPYG